MVACKRMRRWVEQRDGLMDEEHCTELRRFARHTRYAQGAPRLLRPLCWAVMLGHHRIIHGSQ